MITCERFITVKHVMMRRKQPIVTPTAMVDMDITTVAMAKGGNMKICWRTGCIWMASDDDYSGQTYL